MIRIELFSLKADEEGKAEKVIELKGFIEKIEIVYDSMPKEVYSEDTHIIMEADDGKKVFDFVGEKNGAWYPRTEVCDITGTSIFQEGNKIVTRFLVGESLNVGLETKPGTLVEAVIIYYEPIGEDTY